MQRRERIGVGPATGRRRRCTVDKTGAEYIHVTFTNDYGEHRPRPPPVETAPAFTG